MTYYAVAFTKHSHPEKFGLPFETEDAAWKWLHSDCIWTPEHDSIDVLEYFAYRKKFEEWDQSNAQDVFSSVGYGVENPDSIPF